MNSCVCVIEPGIFSTPKFSHFHKWSIRFVYDTKKTLFYCRREDEEFIYFFDISGVSQSFSLVGFLILSVFPVLFKAILKQQYTK